MSDHMRDYQRKRDKDPTITLYWIAQAPELKKVQLNSLSCMFCKTTLWDEMSGTIDHGVNAPSSLDDIAMALTVRCKFCKQNYRLAIPKSQLPELLKHAIIKGKEPVRH